MPFLTEAIVLRENVHNTQNMVAAAYDKILEYSYSKKKLKRFLWTSDRYLLQSASTQLTGRIHFKQIYTLGLY